MTKSQLRSLIQEEIKKTLNEGAVTKAIKPALQGELKIAVMKLEKLLQSTGAILDYNHADKIAYAIIDIIDAAKEEGRNEIDM
jgi:uncharacterized FlaG/YvyC family protein